MEGVWRERERGRWQWGAKRCQRHPAVLWVEKTTWECSEDEFQLVWVWPLWECLLSHLISHSSFCKKHPLSEALCCELFLSLRDLSEHSGWQEGSLPDLDVSVLCSANILFQPPHWFLKDCAFVLFCVSEVILFLMGGVWWVFALATNLHFLNWKFLKELLFCDHWHAYLLPHLIIILCREEDEFLQLLYSYGLQSVDAQVSEFARA